MGDQNDHLHHLNTLSNKELTPRVGDGGDVLDKNSGSCDGGDN